MLVLSQFVERALRRRPVGDSAEGVGYLLKDRVADFAASPTPSAASARAAPRSIPPWSRRCSAAAAATTRSTTLTPRERDVLELMAQGRSNRGIADALVVTPHAVEKHVTNIFAKLGVGEAAEDHRRVLAVLRFMRA